MTPGQLHQFQIEIDALLAEIAASEGMDAVGSYVLSVLVAQARSDPGGSLSMVMDIARRVNAALVRIKEAE